MLIVYPASWTSTPCATSSATSQSTPQTTPGPDLDRGKRKPLRRCGLDPTKTIEALVGTQGSCNLPTESLTLDQLCGGRAGAAVPAAGCLNERHITTIRREYLDQTLLWTAADLENKLRLFQDCFNRQRVHSGLGGWLPDSQETPTPLNFDSYRWQQHCRGLYQTPIPA
jgi:hypothetical protein